MKRDKKVDRKRGQNKGKEKKLLVMNEDPDAKLHSNHLLKGKNLQEIKG